MDFARLVQELTKRPIIGGLHIVALVGIDGSRQSPGGLLQIDGLIMAGLVQLRPRHLMRTLVVV